MAQVYFDPAVGGDGSTVSDDANATTGLKRGGYLTRFVPALAQMVAVASTVVARVNTAVSAAAAALASQNSAATSASNAQLAQNQTQTIASSTATSIAQSNALLASAQTQVANASGTVALTGVRGFLNLAQAQANLSSFTNDQVISVFQDETRGNQGSFYKAVGSPVNALVFVRAHDSFVSPLSYVQSDSYQNMILKLLVLGGAIPQSTPVVDADFTNPAYLP